MFFFLYWKIYNYICDLCERWEHWWNTLLLLWLGYACLGVNVSDTSALLRFISNLCMCNLHSMRTPGHHIILTLMKLTSHEHTCLECEWTKYISKCNAYEHTHILYIQSYTILHIIRIAYPFRAHRSYSQHMQTMDDSYSLLCIISQDSKTYILWHSCDSFSLRFRLIIRLRQIRRSHAVRCLSLLWSYQRCAFVNFNDDLESNYGKIIIYAIWQTQKVIVTCRVNWTGQQYVCSFPENFILPKPMWVMMMINAINACVRNFGLYVFICHFSAFEVIHTHYMLYYLFIYALSRMRKQQGWPTKAGKTETYLADELQLIQNRLHWTTDDTQCPWEQNSYFWTWLVEKSKWCPV